MIKPFLVALLSFSFLTAVHAKDDETAKDKAKREEQEKKDAKEARGKRREAVQALLDVKDKNHDGSLSREEYVDGESDAEAAGKKFDEFNKNKDRFLSKKEIAESLGL